MHSLTRVGPGTPLGQLMRHYWIPVVQSSELKPGGPRVKRVKLLGEDLVVVRSPRGTSDYWGNSVRIDGRPSTLDATKTQGCAVCIMAGCLR